ncbi:MAG: hypothetical protein M0Z30_04180 [Actinomycetota bacterium]|nr:hypothetical protein [Actinomycetota bacterium]
MDRAPSSERVNGELIITTASGAVVVVMAATSDRSGGVGLGSAADALRPAGTANPGAPGPATPATTPLMAYRPGVARAPGPARPPSARADPPPAMSTSRTATASTLGRLNRNLSLSSGGTHRSKAFREVLRSGVLFLAPDRPG